MIWFHKSNKHIGNTSIPLDVLFFNKYLSWHFCLLPVPFQLFCTTDIFNQTTIGLPLQVVHKYKRVGAIWWGWSARNIKRIQLVMVLKTFLGLIWKWPFKWDLPAPRSQYFCMDGGEMLLEQEMCFSWNSCFDSKLHSSCIQAQCGMLSCFQVEVIVVPSFLPLIYLVNSIHISREAFGKPQCRLFIGRVPICSQETWTILSLYLQP